MASRSDIEAGRAFVRLYVNKADFETGLKSARKLLGDTADAMKSIGKALLGIGIAGGIPILLSAKKFADFDDAMRAARAAASFTADEMESLSEKVLEVADALRYPPIEVANMAATLARADFKIEELEAVTRAVLEMARATGTDAVLAADIFSQSYKVFNLRVEDAGHLADVMTLAANRSIISVENLGDSMKYAGRLAVEFGMSLEETVAIVAGIGRLGIIGEMAGTTMRRLLTISGADAKKLKNLLGVSFTDAAGNIRPLTESLEEVHDKLSTLSSSDRAAKLRKAFGILGISGAEAIGSSTMAIKELRKEMETTTNFARDAADMMNQGLGGALRKVITILDIFQIRLGKIFSGELKSLVGYFDTVVNALTKFAQANKDFLTGPLMQGLVAVTLTGAGLLALGVTLRWTQYAVSGLLSTVALLGGGLGLLLSPISQVNKSSRFLNSALANVFRTINVGAGNAVGWLFRLFSSGVTAGGSVLLSLLGQAGSLLLRLPSFATSAARGVGTAFSNMAQAGKVFLLALSGKGSNPLGPIMMNIRGLGYQLRTLVIHVHQYRYHIMRAVVAMSYLAGPTGAAFRSALDLRFAIKGLLGIKVAYQSLSMTQKQLYSAGAMVRWSAIQIGNAFVIAYRQSRGAAVAFYKALMGHRIFYPSLTPLQRAFFDVGARINYVIRSHILAPLRQAGSAFMAQPIVQKIVAISNQARALGTVFRVALSSAKITLPQFAALTPLQQHIWTLGKTIRMRFLLPLAGGFRALKVIGTDVFRVIAQAGTLAGRLTLVAWRIVGPVAGSVIKASLITSFKVVQAVGSVTAKAVSAGFRSAFGALGSLVSLISMALGDVGGVVGQFLMIGPSILMLIPSLFGLINPIGLVVAGLAGAAAYWILFSERGQAALRWVQAALAPTLAIFMKTFKGIKDALSGGEVMLAAKIAVAGLRVVFLDAFVRIGNSIGGLWGDTIKQLGGELLTGDFSAAWETTLTALHAAWSLFTEGIVKVWETVSKKVAEIWNGTINKIADKILELASDDGIVGAALSKVLGVDMRAEKARAERLERERVAKGLASPTTAVSDAAKSAEQTLSDYFREMQNKLNEPPEVTTGRLKKNAERGKGIAEKALEDAQAELDDLVSQAAAKAAAAKAAEPDLTIPEGPTAQADNNLPGLAQGSNAQNTGIKEGTATFSAYAAIASSQQNTVREAILTHVKETRKVVKALVESNEKEDKIIAAHEKFFAGLSH